MVTLEYRGKEGIREWLQQPESETIAAYWFDKAVIPRNHWRHQFERVKSAWMDLRYVPDLHVSTILDRELSWFANSPRMLEGLKSKISRLSCSLQGRRERLKDLPNLPGDHSDQTLKDSVLLVDSIDDSLANLSLLLEAAQSDFLPLIEGNFSIEPDTRTATFRLQTELKKKDKQSLAYAPTHSVLKSVEGLLDTLNDAHELLQTQQGLRRMRLIFGDAGTGKTQTITKICDSASQEGVPILLLPSRAFDPSTGWNEILGRAIDRPGWTASEILDALEAAALFEWRNGSGPVTAPRRAILAIDGPDESSEPWAWAERLKELADLCRTRPLVAALVTTRPESQSWLPMDGGRFESVFLQAPDLEGQLPEIFQAYTKEYDIDVPSSQVVAWTLRTPLAIRIFAEVYRGRAIAVGQNFVTTLAELFTLKLRKLDEEICRKHSSWVPDKELSLRILTELLPEFLDEGECTYERFSTCVRNCLTKMGVEAGTATEIFERSTYSHGILEFRRVPGGAMEPSKNCVRPSFNAILDYLLAKHAVGRIKVTLSSKRPDKWLLVKVLRHFPQLDKWVASAMKNVHPQALSNRANAQSLVVAILLGENISLLNSGLWRLFVEESDLEQWHARAIRDLPTDKAVTHRCWVSQTLVRDMVSCRMIISELILPSSRVPTAAFGTEFLHQEFKTLSLTERDLVWSGPDYLPSNCRGPWEGHAPPIHDAVRLRDDDSATSVPILAAWITSSVIQARQRRAIAELAQWGSKRPGELATLFSRFGSINDVQVVESIAVAAAGAVLKLIGHGAADELAKSSHTIFFKDQENLSQPSVVARHAARLVIERAFKIGTDLPNSVRSDATPPYAPIDQKLPIDGAEVSNVIMGEGGSNLLFMDLDWYVASDATDPFFEEVQHNHCEPQARKFGMTPDPILYAVIEKRWDVDPAIMAEITQEIEDSKNDHESLTIDLSLVAKAAKQTKLEAEYPAVGEKIEPPLSGSPEIEANRSKVTGKNFPNPIYSKEAEELLIGYAHELSTSNPLKPKQLGNGLIVALVRSWGWNENTFVGDPQGGGPGEILGADISIRREHSSASHGSRSAIAAFGEKYVWSAVNVVSSFLCDRLPGRDSYGSPLEPITNQSALGSGMPDPFIGHSLVPEQRSPWIPEGIVPRPKLIKKSHPDRGIEWLGCAEWPSPENWLQTGSEEPILLSGSLFSKEHDAGIQIAAWVSCVAIPREKLSLIERDAKHVPEVWKHRAVHTINGHFEGGFYNPVNLAVWAPWAGDDKTTIWHTLSNSGEPSTIDVIPLVTKSYWEGMEGETEGYSPSKLLREAGDIIDCVGHDSTLRFVDRAREEVAYFQRTMFEQDWGKSNRYLSIRHSLLMQTMAEHDLVPIWGVRVYRELIPQLRPEGAWVDQDAYWIVLPRKDSNFTSIRVWHEQRDERDSHNISSKA